MFRSLKLVYRGSKQIMPALVVLFFTVGFYFYFGDITFVKGWEEGIYRVFFRFFRFTLFLCLSLYLLIPIYRLTVERLGGRLLQVKVAQGIEIYPFKHWIFRPFQGIGIGLLFETKLLTTLQLVTGVATPPFLFPGHFQLRRLLAISAITVAVSLFLSIFWTLDDMGIRYVNMKDQELKMIGKYAGTLMPILFGFYGIFGLVSSFPKVQALTYLFKTIVVLYPPFVVFAVFHNHFIRTRWGHFSGIKGLKKGRILREE